MEQKNVCKHQFFKTFATPAFMTLISDNKIDFARTTSPLREPVIQRTFKGQYQRIHGFFSFYVPRRESCIRYIRFRHRKLSISIAQILGVGFRRVVCTPIEEERKVLLIRFSNS